MKECFECGKLAQHNHHVVPESLGGTKTVPLCEDCHSKVHGKDLSLSGLQREAVRKTIEKYKLDGKQWGGGGWNKLENKVNPKVVLDMRRNGMTLREIAKNFGVCCQTISNLISRQAYITNEG